MAASYSNITEAFISNLFSVLFHPDFIVSPRGLENREKLNVNFSILNPTQRICLHPMRKANIVFNFAETLWHLSGSNNLEFIGYYSNKFSQYSNDGVYLDGSAYGPRIFSFGSHKVNQWKKLVTLFKEDDEESRRGVIQIFDPDESVSISNKDVACASSLHFIIRNKKLYMTTFMRANDAYRGFVSDIFFFTFLQELLATELNYSLGHYYHCVASMDIFHSDLPKIEKIVSSNEGYNHLNAAVPSMPKKDPWACLNVIFELEEQLRKNELSLDLKSICNLPLPHYWQQIIGLFIIYQHSVWDKGPVSTSLVDWLEPVYRFMLEHNQWYSKINPYNTHGRRNVSADLRQNLK